MAMSSGIMSVKSSHSSNKGVVWELFIPKHKIQKQEKSYKIHSLFTPLDLNTNTFDMLLELVEN